MTAAADSRDRALAHDRLADTFDAVMNPYDVGRRLEVLIDEFLSGMDLRGRLVLDAGCGTGRATAVLAARGARVVALDLGLNLTAYTKARYPCRPVTGSLLELPFGGETFDVVLSSEAIEHTPDPALCVRELSRVLKAGGHLVLSTPNWLWQLPTRIASRLKLRPYDGLENFMSPRALRRAVRQGGLSLAEHKGIHLLPFQFAFLWPALRGLDRFGGPLLPVMINQCIHATKGSP